MTTVAPVVPHGNATDDEYGTGDGQGTSQADLEMGAKVREEMVVLPTELPKRPKEIPPEGITGRAEIEALVKQGRKEAEAAILGAGFMGGDSETAIRVWSACALFGLLGFAWWSIVDVVITREINNFFGYLEIIFFAILAGCSSRAYFLQRRRLRAAAQSLAWCFMIIGITLVHAFTGVWASWGGGCLYVTFIFTGLGLLIALMGAFLFFGKLKMVSGMLQACSLYIGISVLLHAICANDLGPYIYDPIISILSISSFAFLRYERYKSLKEAADLVKEDAERYDQVWEQFESGKGDSLHSIETTVAAIRDLANKDSAFLRNQGQGEEASGSQLLRKYTAETRQVLEGAMLAAGMRRPRQRIDDLFVLFVQAHALSEHFQALVNTWSRAPEGSSTEFGAVNVHDCPPKRLSRAIEKLHRSYGGDGGRLIDLVRSSITFGDMNGLVACLQRIVADHRVAILGCKNRFTPSYNSEISAGYRNLSLSLVIVDEFTMERRIETHVCELQLGLRVLDELKNDGGHQRYVQWRNQRAE